MNEFKEMWVRYFDFGGRTTVRGYWMAFLFNFLASLVLGFIVGIIPSLGVLVTIYSLAAFIPGLSIFVRRMRDAGKHWAWIFISLVPLVGWIVLLVFLCSPSVGGGTTTTTTTTTAYTAGNTYYANSSSSQSDDSYINRRSQPD